MAQRIDLSNIKVRMSTQMVTELTKALIELPSLEVDPIPATQKAVKLFNALGIGTWELVAFNPKTHIAFGMCTLFESEMGYVSLLELFEAVPMLEMDYHYDKTWKDINPYI